MLPHGEHNGWARMGYSLRYAIGAVVQSLFFRSFIDTAARPGAASRAGFASIGRSPHGAGLSLPALPLMPRATSTSGVRRPAGTADCPVRRLAFRAAPPAGLSISW